MAKTQDVYANVISTGRLDLWLDCLLGSAEQLCSKLATDLTHAVVQATDMFSQVKMHLFLLLLSHIIIIIGCRSNLLFYLLSATTQHLNLVANCFVCNTHILGIFWPSRQSSARVQYLFGVNVQTFGFSQKSESDLNPSLAFETSVQMECVYNMQ